MSWALPVRCETTAKALKERATLMGASFRVNAEPAAQVAEPAPTTDAPAADAPTPEAPKPEAPQLETPAPSPNR